MIIKGFVIFAFVLIVISLGSALFHLVKHGENEESEKTLRALTVRIVLSIVLFIVIFLAYATGLVEPEGLGARIHQVESAAKKPQ